jgi:soluble lytic murein transglycosylase-like protein
MLINKPVTAVLPVLVVLSVAGLPVRVDAQIYSWRDANGNLVLANAPKAGAGQVVRPYPAAEKQLPAVPIRTPSQTSMDRARMYDGIIIEQARARDVRPDLVRAVVQVESAYNPNARSPKGAQGLMQLMPATALQFGVRNAYNPEENVRAGVTYLRQLLDRYNNDETLALAAYNAGPGAVDKYGRNVPPYAETKNYVRQISQMTARPVAPRGNVIYKVTEVVGGRPVVRYTDKRPASGTYEIIGR